MKGAMADVWARINKPPNNNITTTIGINQNFFRERRKAQSSDSMDTNHLRLKLIPHGFRRRPRGDPEDPVCAVLRRMFETQEIISQKPKQECHRRERQVK